MRKLLLIALPIFLIACSSDEDGGEEIGVQNLYNDSLALADSAEIQKTTLLEDSINGRPNNKVVQRDDGLRIEWEIKSTEAKIGRNDIPLINYSARVAGGETYDGNAAIGKPVPVHIGTGTLVKGMEDGLLEMAKGDDGRIMIPNALGYGEDGYETIIPPNADLIIDIEIVDVIKPIELEKGVLVYKWQRNKNGKKPEKNKWIEFDYFAYAKGDPGIMYDNSYQNGTPYRLKFQNDNVIEGLHIAMSVMNDGENAMVYIPAEVAYGSKGIIDKVEPNTDLLYDIRILSVD